AYTKWHLSGNYIDRSANQKLNDDNYLGLDISEYKENVPTCTIDDLKSDWHQVKYPVNTETAHDAFNTVMAKAGAFPRDTVDRRIINEATTGTATYHGSFNNHKLTGIIDRVTDVGGWPEYRTYNTITDNDHDGMDDAWELSNGFDPTNPDDRNIYVQSGHTVLEVYLNSLCGETIPLELGISQPKVHDFLVAQDGTGDFTSINEAIDAVPEDGTRYSIFIKKGTYNEKVFIGNRWQTSNKIISLIGENVDSVVIIWDDYHGKTISYPGKEGTISADGMTAPTMTVTSPDFYMENITVKNPSTEAQAEALYQAGDRQVLKNCKILGNQDTHRTKKGRRYFNFRCTIEGGVDFIYAGGTCYFYQCDIVSNRGGYISAPEDITYKSTLSNGKTLRYGFFFKDCDILATDGVTTSDVYLGRPWGPECGSVFLNCRLGDHINPKGWNTMGAGNELSACFAEYQSMNADGTAFVDVSNRIDWSMQLSTADVNNFMLLSKIYSKVSSNEFDPVSMITAPLAPNSVGVKDGNRVVWTPNNDAKGYVVYSNGLVIGFSKTNAFIDTLSYATTPTYNVREVGEIGNLSPFKGETEDYSYESIIEAIDTPLSTVGVHNINVSKMPRIEKGIIYFDNFTRLKVYNLYGHLFYSDENCSSYNLGQLENGIFIFRVSDETGNVYSFKMRR
ncbi:MAG TPA: pectinesterase family protein, partial [Prolixibacteraceae bacterium]|nr:pectinesterase family protein [Prolixibacteraceae bacterium]